MEKLLADLEMLRQQIDAALENATQGARESHQSWTERLERADEIDARLSARWLDEIQEERRREMLNLGQASGLAWVGMRLGHIVDAARAREETIPRDRPGIDRARQEQPPQSQPPADT